MKNRVAAIHEVTSPPQWKHVVTKQNPADNALHGLEAEALLKDKRWIQRNQKIYAWPSQQCSTPMLAENDPEVKRESQVLSTEAEAGPTIG